MRYILFSLGALTMIVEFSIPRLIAPAYGNTLFSWTAIISVVLISMTVGYYVGGRISNSARTPKLIIAFGLISAIWTILIAVVGSQVVEMFSGLNLIVGPVVTSIIFALIPTFLNAAIVPMAISTFNEPSGSASGKCFSISTIGSISGVVLTGYVLLPFLGISGTLLTGSALYFLALLAHQPKYLGVIGIAITMVVGWWTTTQAQADDFLVDHSNGYHRIKIQEVDIDGEMSRSIFLDSTLEGRIDVGRVSSYLPGITSLVADIDDIQTALVIGGGAFSTPRYLKRMFPDAVIDVIELDPDVVKYAREYMELDDQVNVYIGDGRNVLRSLDKKYDLIFNDAFRGFKNIPSHLTTVEFNRLIKSKLTDRGMYAVNVRGYPSDSYLAASLLKTMQNDFGYLVETGQDASNLITVASEYKLQFGRALTGTYDMGTLLTDNRSPTEMLIIADVIRKKLVF